MPPQPLQVRFLRQKIFLLRTVALISFILLPFQIKLTIDTDYYKIFFHPEFLFGILDLVLLGNEIAQLGVYLHQGRITLDAWASHGWVLYAILCWTMLVLLILEAILRVVSGAFYFAQKPFALFDFRAYWRLSPSRPEISTVHHALFGVSIWKEHFIGESVGIRFSRGTVPAACVAALLAFSIVGIVIEPIAETAMVPVKDLRTMMLPDSLVINPPVWNVVVAWGLTGPDNWNESFHSAVEVTPLGWDDPQPSTPKCNHLPDIGVSGGRDESFQFIIVNCTSEDVERAGGGSNRYFYATGPDLLITINYTKLGLPIDHINLMQKNAVQVIVSMTDNTGDALDRTIPTSIPAGVNLMGNVYVEVRQLTKMPFLSSFGLFQASRAMYIASVHSLYPDPQTSISPLIPHSPDISTLRLYTTNEFSEWRIIQDYRQKSVINGFADTGGLWTFLSGVFAAIFGSSLMRILFGMKPISVFGLVHKFQRTRIQEACLDEYPKIPRELSLPKPERGLLSLLRDHLIDLEFLVGYTEDSNNNSTEEVTNDDESSPGL